MFQKLRAWWKDHGTKILGYGGTLIGSLSMLDAATLNLIKTTLGPKWGPLVYGALMILGGIMVAKRGYTNSTNSRNALPATNDTVKP
jgi:hypothetical protein